ncbi:MAG: dockerin type I domain-containing protein [Clostridia bacterium]|nr:dockerin type I domain-containing protein [Clostridia bacterium]
MKIGRLFSGFVALCLVISLFAPHLAFSSAAQTAPLIISMETDGAEDIISVLSSEVIKGDINGDGRVSLKDIALLKQYICGYEIGAVRQAMDVDADGRVNLKDYLSVKLMLCGKQSTEGQGNTVLEKCISSEENAVLLTVAGEGGDAFFDIDMSSADTEPYGYCAVVWKNAEKAEVGFVDSGYSTKKCDAVTSGGTGEYTYILFALPENRNSLKFIQVIYDGTPAAGDTLFLDSVIFSATEEETAAAAQERIGLRSVSGKDSYVTVSLDTPEAVALFGETGNLNLTSENGYVSMTSVGAEGSYGVLNLDGFGISADDYNYLVYTVMLPASDGSPLPTGRITFYAGDAVREPENGTAGGASPEYSLEYSLLADGIFHSYVIDMTDADFWSGNVHGLKIDSFSAPRNGAVCGLKSVVFCNSYGAARKVCEGRAYEVSDSRLLYDYGLYRQGSMQMAYRYYIPENYVSGEDYPLLTILHGASFRGLDGVCQLYAGFPLLLDSTDDTARSSIVFAPQCPEEYRWVESDWTLGRYSIKNVPESEPVKAVLDMLERLSERFSTDRDRFYVTGYSMGGYGTWDLLSRHGELFAAGMPLCGGGDTSAGAALADIPIRAFHGTADTTVPTLGSENMYKSILRAGGTKITYTALEGMGHNVWDTVYADEENMQWLFSHRLSDRTE